MFLIRSAALQIKKAEMEIRRRDFFTSVWDEGGDTKKTMRYKRTLRYRRSLNMVTESPFNIRTKFPGPGSSVVRRLIRDYNCEPLPPDPGPGPIVTSYRLYLDVLRQKASLAHELHPAVFLRRLLWAYFQQKQKAVPQAPDHAFTQPKPGLEPVVLPKGNGRIELDAEQAKAALVRVGACQSPQASSRYFLVGQTLTREEDGKVLQTWEVPK